MSTIQLPAEAVTAICSKAILDSLDASLKETLVKDAIAYLISPTKTNSWENRESPLQKAFHEAMHKVATDLITKEVAADTELTAKLKAVIVEAVDKALSGESRNKLIENLSYAVAKGMKIDSY